MTTSPPSQPDEAARLVALHHDAPRDDRPLDADLGALVRLAGLVCRVPIAALNLGDDVHPWYTAGDDPATAGAPRRFAFCDHSTRGHDIVEIADARLDPEFAASPLVTGDPHVVFYAGAPLVTRAGDTVGALCIADQRPRVLSPDEREALRLLARQVVQRLDQDRALATLRALGRERVAHLEQLRRHTDVTARSEQRLALVLQAVDAGVWDWDLETGDVHFSPRFAELLELASDGPLPIEQLFIAVDDHELEALHTAFGDLFSRRLDRLWQEFAVRTAGGDPRWLRFRGQVTAWGADGAPQRAVGLVVDISSDRRRADQLRASHKLDALGGLAAGVAHEINTPLQVVSHNLDYLASQCGQVVTTIGTVLPADDARTLHDDVAGAIAESIDGLDRVTHIVRALKEFSHQGTTARERVDVNQMIEHAIALTRHEWKFVADVERDLAPGLPAVPAAAYECGQLLVNLLVNAAHAVLAATRPGTRGRIGVVTRRLGPQVEIRVWDTGIGIAPDIRDRVFDPFFTTKGVGQGTGQGLTTARGIVERHGGTIAFDSEVGRGTTFVVRLPAAPGAAQAA